MRFIEIRISFTYNLTELGIDFFVSFLLLLYYQQITY
jgi:hypothetical protein